MKEPMKHIILTVAMLCGTAQAAIHGIPSDRATCALVGAIAGAAATYQSEGVSLVKTVKDIESTLKQVAPKNGSPPWARKIIESSWGATRQVPAITGEMADELMTARCLQK